MTPSRRYSVLSRALTLLSRLLGRMQAQIGRAKLISLRVPRRRGLAGRQEWPRDLSGLKGGQLASDRQSKCRGWSRAGVGHANSQDICGLSVLMTRYRDGTFRNITSKRCPILRLGSGDTPPGRFFRRYSNNANGRLLLLLLLALAVRGSQLRTCGNGLSLPWLCRRTTIWMAAVWSSTDQGLCN
jgi:hypothetical protein